MLPHLLGDQDWTCKLSKLTSCLASFIIPEWFFLNWGRSRCNVI